MESTERDALRKQLLQQRAEIDGALARLDAIDRSEDQRDQHKASFHLITGGKLALIGTGLVTTIRWARNHAALALASTAAFGLLMTPFATPYRPHSQKPHRHPVSTAPARKQRPPLVAPSPSSFASPTKQPPTDPPAASEMPMPQGSIGIPVPFGPAVPPPARTSVSSSPSARPSPTRSRPSTVRPPGHGHRSPRFHGRRRCRDGRSRLRLPCR